jgi:hypothetical protein
MSCLSMTILLRQPDHPLYHLAIRGLGYLPPGSHRRPVAESRKVANLVPIRI